jgi:hypothetical protein
MSVAFFNHQTYISGFVIREVPDNVAALFIDRAAFAEVGDKGRILERIFFMRERYIDVRSCYPSRNKRKKNAERLLYVWDAETIEKKLLT